MPFAAMPADGQHAPVPATGESSTMKVQPDKVLALKKQLEDVRDDINEFLQTKGEQLRVPPMAADPVSGDASSEFTTVANTAIDVATAYVDQLNQTIDGLGHAAKTYGLAEDANIATFDRRD